MCTLSYCFTVLIFSCPYTTNGYWLNESCKSDFYPEFTLSYFKIVAVGALTLGCAAGRASVAWKMLCVLLL